jgi:hypothetical protein
MIQTAAIATAAAESVVRQRDMNTFTSPLTDRSSCRTAV